MSIHRSRMRCCSCGKAVSADNFSDSMAHATFDKRICKNCEGNAPTVSSGEIGTTSPNNNNNYNNNSPSHGRRAIPSNTTLSTTSVSAVSPSSPNNNYQQQQQQQSSSSTSSSSLSRPPQQQQQQQGDEQSKAIRTLMTTKPSNDRISILRRIAAIKELYPDNRSIKYFDINWFNNTLSPKQQEEFLWIINSGIRNQASSVGCYAMKPDDYNTYRAFFDLLLADYHRVPVGQKHRSSWDISSVSLNLPSNGKLDLGKLGLPPVSIRSRVARNLTTFPLPGRMTKQDRIEMEQQMIKVFENLSQHPDFGGAYYSLTPGIDAKYAINEQEYQALVDAHFMFKDMSKDPFLVQAGLASSWPFGRGCYVSDDRHSIIWVNEEDHLRIISMKKGTVLNDVFDRLKEILDIIEQLPGMKFARDGEMIVASCPSNCGTGMRASIHMCLPALTIDGTEKKAKVIAKKFGLSVRGVGGEHTPIGVEGTVDVSPQARYCITEAEIMASLYKGIAAMKVEEDKAAAIL